MGTSALLAGRQPNEAFAMVCGEKRAQEAKRSEIEMMAGQSTAHCSHNHQDYIKLHSLLNVYRTEKVR